MKISDKHVVHYHFTVKDENGEIVQSSEGDEPLVYLHGYNNIVPGLEKAMAGRAKGDSFSVTVTPEEGFGHHRDNLIQRIPIKHLQGAKKWKPGMVALVDTKQGYRQVRLLKVGRFMADADLNHPLAGKTLTFEVEVVDIRDATKEELAHGHAHENPAQTS